MLHALRRTSLGSLVSTGLLLALACGSPGPAAGPTITITGVGWYEENVDPTIWTTPPPNGQTAFYDFIIHYTGEITFGDIEYARVYLPGGTTWWTINRNPSLFDASARTIGGWGHWFDHTHPNLLPIGSLVVEVKLTSGAVSRHTRLVPAPGSLTAGPYTTMHTEDLLSPPAASAPMIRRAVVGAAGTITAATQTIAATFSVTDPGVYNGFVWLFDAAGLYLGTTGYFRDQVTGLPGPLVGGALATNGTPNTLAIQAADVHFTTGATFSQVAGLRVVLTDGAQYGLRAGGYGYDCQSISALVTLTPQ